MLRFTSAGAVQSPTTLQVRVTRRFPGRVAAGAPSPERSLDDDEVRENLRHFTVGMRGPRTRPCTSLVLSGVLLAEREGLASVVSQGREWGIERVVLHLGSGQRDLLAHSALSALVDAVAMTVRTSADLEDLRALTGLHRSAVVELSHESLGDLVELATGLADARPDRVVFTWPFPPAAPPPSAQVTADALVEPLSLLDGAGLCSGVKGLPACRLGAMGERLWRSQNRWYVDATHQCGDALAFFPDVVRFAKVDACRWCSADARCDGAPEAWLQAGLTGRLEPLAEDA